MQQRPVERVVVVEGKLPPPLIVAELENFQLEELYCSIEPMIEGYLILAPQNIQVHSNVAFQALTAENSTSLQAGMWET